MLNSLKRIVLITKVNYKCLLKKLSDLFFIWLIIQFTLTVQVFMRYLERFLFTIESVNYTTSRSVEVKHHHLSE